MIKTNFEHVDYENLIYKTWEDNTSFAPKPRFSNNKRFCIIMPPPNANDPLHLGHAMFVTIEDILIRFHRMLGEETLWLPGTDHAGIETQYVFEKKLSKQGRSRFDYDRGTLYKMIWDYVKENSGVAVNQMKRLGASADWSRYKFTLDVEVVDFVLDTFIKLYNEGLVYRKERLVNFCTKCGTSYSELEVEHVEREDYLFFISYPLASADGSIIVATTRPETLLGDVAIAVNPKDKRYLKLIGLKVKLPLTEREIPIVADDMVDMNFGTGAVKITPAHDQADWEVAERLGWDLSVITSNCQVIDYSGKMNSNSGPIYQGVTVEQVREKVLIDLKGLLVKKEAIRHTVGICYRCGRTIEPLPRPQIFIKVNSNPGSYSLTREVIGSLDSNQVRVHGAGREAILRDWLNNLQDWNISRQIVWGIRIPIWYNIKDKEDWVRVSYLDKSGSYRAGVLSDLLSSGAQMSEIRSGLQQLLVPVNTDNSIPYVVSKDLPPQPGEWLQDTDTLDTWFSSGQWPVVSLKTGLTNDFEKFYPTSVMETGYDILPFWVMRMLMMCMFLEKDAGENQKVPFREVYLHGLIRDEKGIKMSKSKGNVINPLEMVDKYGADALRMALVMSSTPGQDKNIGENIIRGMRNFSNKIWNASRYVILQNDIGGPECEEGSEAVNSRLNKVISSVTQLLNDLKIGLAAEIVYNEFWHWFCDSVIELHKEGKVSTSMLKKCLDTFLRLLHPFVPFVTEAILLEWKKGIIAYPFKSELLITSIWPDEG